MPLSSTGKDAAALRQRSLSQPPAADAIPVRLPISKQQRLLRDMAAQQAESEQRAVLERYQNQAYASSMKVMRSLFLLAIVGIIGFAL
jgi:hypothetical protein